MELWAILVVRVPTFPREDTDENALCGGNLGIAGIAVGAFGLQALHAQAKPKAYVVIETEVLDEAAFKEFVPKVAEANKAAGGTFLARGGGVPRRRRSNQRAALPTLCVLLVAVNRDGAQPARLAQKQVTCIGLADAARVAVADGFDAARARLAAD